MHSLFSSQCASPFSKGISLSSHPIQEELARISTIKARIQDMERREVRKQQRLLAVNSDAAKRLVQQVVSSNERLEEEEEEKVSGRKRGRGTTDNED